MVSEGVQCNGCLALMALVRGWVGGGWWRWRNCWLHWRGTGKRDRQAEAVCLFRGDANSETRLGSKHVCHPPRQVRGEGQASDANRMRLADASGVEVIADGEAAGWSSWRLQGRPSRTGRTLGRVEQSIQLGFSLVSDLEA